MVLLSANQETIHSPTSSASNDVFFDALSMPYHNKSLPRLRSAADLQSLFPSRSSISSGYHRNSSIASLTNLTLRSKSMSNLQARALSHASMSEKNLALFGKILKSPTSSEPPSKQTRTFKWLIFASRTFKTLGSTKYYSICFCLLLFLILRKRLGFFFRGAPSCVIINH